MGNMHTGNQFRLVSRLLRSQKGCHLSSELDVAMISIQDLPRQAAKYLHIAHRHAS